MKKVILILFSVFYLLSCKNSETEIETHSNDDDTLTAEEWAKYPEIKKADVESMVKYYYEMPKNDSNVIRGVVFDNPQIRKILKNKLRMKIYVGAYDSDGAGRKKGEVILILQLKEKDKPAVYYNYADVFPKSSMAAEGICPPPYNSPCPVTEEN